MIKIYYKSAKEKIIAELQEFRINTLVYVENPSEEDLNTLVDKFSLDISLLLDSLDRYELPRVELEDGIVYIFTRFAFTQRDNIDTAPLLIAIKKGFVIMVSREPFPRLQMVLNGKTESISTAQQRKLLFRVLSQVNATYYDHLNTISKRIRSLSVGVQKIKNKDIIQFVNFENVLEDFNASLVRINAILGTLMGGRIIKFSEDETDAVEDLSLESVQLTQLTKESLRSMVNIREAYSTIMTNNLNQVIKLFTSLTVILTVPTIIASLYGMNVKLPFDTNTHAFWGIVVVIVAFVGFAIYIFRRNDWM